MERARKCLFWFLVALSIVVWLWPYWSLVVKISSWIVVGLVAIGVWCLYDDFPADRRSWFYPIEVVVGCGILAILLYTSLSDGMKLSGCERHLKRLGVALEGYKNDHGGYPADLDRLIPRYLRQIPACPAGGQYRYRTGNPLVRLLPEQARRYVGWSTRAF